MTVSTRRKAGAIAVAGYTILRPAAFACLSLRTFPQLGYKVYFVRAVSSAGANTGHAAVSGAAAMPELKASSDSLENEFVRIKVDPKTGCMTSLFDKRSQTEALAPAETDTGGPQDRVCGNLLQTFVDKPKRWDAWNIDADFEKQMWDLDQADEVKLVESGPLRAVIRVKNHFQNSTFVQDITTLRRRSASRRQNERGMARETHSAEGCVSAQRA